jgi:hypothetical protein
MEQGTILRSFREKVCQEIELEQEGLDRFVVHTPFLFEDGDHFAILLKRNGGGWALTDEGHTFMHLRYDDIDLERGTRGEIIERVLGTHRVRNVEGELRLDIPREEYGDALFSYLQALTRIADVGYLTRERVRSTFLADVRAFFAEHAPEARRTFDYFDPEKDPEGKYPIDLRVNGFDRPLFALFINSDDRCRDATITLHQFEKWGRRFRAIGVFEDQEAIHRRVLARFSDVCDKQFSNFEGTKERLEDYLMDALVGER